ncbi:hypothetical protein [Methanospirillum lacunae]|uniref:Uncharacterized protein n=1 Tax=Methanospirillum lacunae TaxID=668570 RepID=A0A2V2MP79_9EURY|nr:hypothetical protein [Methanospirillum lacunae]PWR70024.1 hypothetical protein DK846_16495 [Methanospirillum lacunae]
MNPVFRIHLPHLFWFLFGCSVLWKVGRLKPDPVNDTIRVIIDGPGEIARIVRSDAWAVINREEGIEVSPGGTVELSTSGHGVVFDIPGKEGGRFVAVAMQVWNMLEYWPKKKAALFEEG